MRQNIGITDAAYFDSDGIARVHGMNNVQAEELVELVTATIQALNF